MPATFPGVGNRYLVDFHRFKVELHFTSLTSLTYTSVAPDGTRGTSETVVISVEEIRSNLFLVTWQEADKTTVVHVEDYDKRTIVTNITNPNNTFDQFHGYFIEVQPTSTLQASQTSFGADIRPLFSARDINCMKNYFVNLDDYQYMSAPDGDNIFSDHANARHVLAHLTGAETPRMPQGGPYWTQSQLDLLKQWMDDGFQP
jgi:hypothetical protein